MAASVEFHTGVPDTAAYACRLLRKASRRGVTVFCLAPDDRLQTLDRLLWTFAERDFVPHVVLGRAAAAGVVARTPIWLAAALPAAEGPGRDVVVNLGGELAPAAARGPARVIEVVGAQADEVERGRALWRDYKAAGFAVVHRPFKSTTDE